MDPNVVCSGTPLSCSFTLPRSFGAGIMVSATVIAVNVDGISAGVSSNSITSIGLAKITLGRPPSPTVVQAGEPVNMQIPAVTNDGTALTYAVDVLPAGLSLDPTTGIITGTPTQTVAKATHFGPVTATVTDTGGALFRSRKFAFELVPAVTVIRPAHQTGAVNTAISPVQVVAFDLNGNAITYSATGLPPGVTSRSKPRHHFWDADHSRKLQRHCDCDGLRGTGECGCVPVGCPGLRRPGGGLSATRAKSPWISAFVRVPKPAPGRLRAVRGPS